MKERRLRLADTAEAAEEWRAVVGYEGAYEVSNLGGVRSLARLSTAGRRVHGKELYPSAAASGHLYVTLRKDGNKRKVGTHVLVLEAFVGPRPDGMDACHWNDNPADNAVHNLRWGTRSENILDQVRNGKHAMASRTSCPQGHAYTPENTYVRENGSRSCRECRRAYQEKNREARRAYGREYMRKKRAALRAQKGAQ